MYARKIFIPKNQKLSLLVLVALLLSVAPAAINLSFATQEVSQISPFGLYPSHGDCFLYLAEGGCAMLAASEVCDLPNYSAASFSIEAIVDIRAYQTGGRWASILSKTNQRGLYDSRYAGWALGFSNQDMIQDKYEIYGKVGDGEEDVCVSSTARGAVHIVMSWNYESRELKLYVNGNLADSKRKPDLNPAMIDTNYDLMMGSLLQELKRNIIMVRWWREELSAEKVRLLADNWLKNLDPRVPTNLNKTHLHSEWLMNQECASDGSVGSGWLKDSQGRNHLRLVGQASLMVSSGEPLSLIYPEHGQEGVNRLLTLKVQGGDSLLGYGVVHPLSYYFQIDTTAEFNSGNLIESGWIPCYGEYTVILKPKTKYYWRVKVRDMAKKSSGYSQIRSFTTEPVSTWYVRPQGGSYGNEDGTSYANAWDGLQNIVWGEAGVEPGDTLYICGLHVHTVIDRDFIGTQADIYPISGADESARIIIRGDYPDDPGIVWGAYRISHESWTYRGNGVWSIRLPASSYGDWYFQDIGKPSSGSFVLLAKESSIQGVKNHPGSHYCDNYQQTGSMLYVKCTDSGNPTGRIYGDRWGYKFKLSDASYITFLNLKFYNTGWSGGASHIRWEGCTIAYGEHSLLSFRDGQDYMEVINCDLSWASNGIYNISTTNNAPSYYRYKGNYIHDIGVRPINYNSDAHAIGIQGGHDGVIEDNIIKNCGTGPLLYAFTSQELKNTIVRRNFITDLHILGGANGVGVSTMCNNNSLSDKSGNEFYHNIVINSPVAYRFQFEQEQKVFNNVACNCEIALESGRNFNGLGAWVNLKNNIFFGSKKYHIRWYSGASNFVIDSDHNLYYPNMGAMFKLGPKELTLNQWKALSLPRCLFDAHSIGENPLFVNASLEYSNSSDFTLQPQSKAINAGVNVGLMNDFAGSPILGFPDIGAFEYHPPAFVARSTISIRP